MKCLVRIGQKPAAGVVRDEALNDIAAFSAKNSAPCSQIRSSSSVFLIF